MVVKRALVLLFVISFIAAGIPSWARAAEPNGAAGVESFINSLLRDPQVQELLQAVVNGLPPTTKEQLEQFAQLAVSGATPEVIEQQLQLIVSSLTETTQSDIEQLIIRLSYVAGLGFMAGAIFKFKQHKNNPQQVHIGEPVAQLFIAAALLIIPSILATTGGTLFGDCAPNCQIQ
jgi:hypothetical protein